jgi:DNA-binding transcriptional regulator YiaG
MNKNVNKNSNGITTCPKCGSCHIEIIEIEHKFPYGKENECIELTANVPSIKCSECGLQVLDKNADEICHDAVCNYLKIMSPKQIKSLRDLYVLTQSQFCEITKLGEATLSRWERGIIIQNYAYDNYLYLLGFEENIDRLIARQGSANIVKENQKPRFRNIQVTEEILKRQKEFELQPCLSTGE